MARATTPMGATMSVTRVLQDWPRLVSRPSLLSITIAAAAVAAVANAVAVATPAAEADQPTRLGTAIQQTMRDRDRQAADRDRALDMREQAQRAAEQRLQDAARPQSAGPAFPQQNGALPPPAPNQPYDGLAKIYQAMKPTRAAPIFEKLAIEVQLQVARRMRDRSTALLLANMSPDAAADLSMALAGHPVPRTPPPRPATVRIAPERTSPVSSQSYAPVRRSRVLPATAGVSPSQRSSASQAQPTDATAQARPAT